MMQRENNLGPRIPAFVKGDVKDAEDALKGARDIIAEQVSEDERARNAVRNLFARQAVISADAYRRLLKPSIETEFASLSKSTGR